MMTLSRQAYGIDISDYSIELMEIRGHMGRLAVTATARVELEPGAMSNGLVQQPDKLIVALQRLQSSAGLERRGIRHAILAVPESQMYLYVFTVPAEVQPEHVGESVQYMAEETLPLSFDQVYHDYQVLSQGHDGTDVLYVACAKPVVDGLRTVCDRAGIVPVVIEPESAALARALIPPGPVAPAVLVDIGSRTTIVTIYDRHGIRYSYTLAIAGNAFTDALMRGRSMSREEAERIKRERLVTVSGQPNELSEPLDQIVERVSTSISYYEHKTGFAVTHVILAGGSSLIPGIDQFIGGRLRLPVSIGKPLQHVQYERSLFPDEKRSVLYATVTGLALRGAGHHRIQEGLNLLRHETAHRQLAVGHWFHRGTQHATSLARPEVRSASHRLNAPLNRMQLLLLVFGFLIVVFVAVLIIRPNG